MEGLIEFISSRKSVPWLASSISPALSALPVNAPLTVPNSVPSIRDSGMAAQLTATKFLSRRELSAWMPWAKISLPVPVSP